MTTMNLPSQLTARQQKFATQYALCGNASEAARRAGYSAKTARVIAQETLLNPAVLEAVRVEQAACAAEFQITKQDVVAGILSAIDMARQQGNPAAIIQGCATLCRMMGFYEPETRKGEPAADVAGMRGKLLAMSDAELLALAQGGSACREV